MPNETNIPATPLTRLEQYWAGILDKIEGGGGNPNYVETIEGTLANPWGDVNPIELGREVLSGNATVLLGYAEEPGVPGVFLVEDDYMAIFSVFAYLFGQISTVSIVYFGGQFSGYDIQGSDGNYTATAISPDTLTTLTIIHHPLPDTTP